MRGEWIPIAVYGARHGLGDPDVRELARRGELAFRGEPGREEVFDVRRATPPPMPAISPLAFSGGGGETSVPLSYAERVMSSLLAMHTALIAEKDERLRLERALTERVRALEDAQRQIRAMQTRLTTAESAQARAPAEPRAPEAALRVVDPRVEPRNLANDVRMDDMAMRLAERVAESAIDELHGGQRSESATTPREEIDGWRAW